MLSRTKGHIPRITCLFPASLFFPAFFSFLRNTVITQFDLHYFSLPSFVLFCIPNSCGSATCVPPGNEVTDLKTKIDAFIGGVHFPWPGPGGCELIVEGSCPLQVGEQYKYHAAMPVLAEYPSVSAIPNIYQRSF